LAGRTEQEGDVWRYIVVIFLFTGCTPDLVGPSENIGVGDCSDGLDNDADGVTDCLDTDCVNTNECLESFEGDEAGECTDGADNDLDGAYDCDDPDCQGSPDCEDVDEEEEIEGDEAGECSDGADNDQDTYFDCDDPGCWGSPDCSGGDADTDVDTDTDTDVDTDTDTDASPNEECLAALEAYGSMDLHFMVYLDFQFNIPGVLTDCMLAFNGDGTIYNVIPDGEKSVLQFDGEWTVDATQTTCSDSILPVGPADSDAVWASDGGTAYHSFVFNSSCTKLADWYAHSEPSEFSVDVEEWYVTDINTTVSVGDVPLVLEWTEIVSPVDPLSEPTYYNQLELTISD
jgi:hypothetical protein